MKLSDIINDECKKNNIKKKEVKKKENNPWIEKYRPIKLKEIVYQDNVIKLLKDTIKTGNLPHLLLYGPPGTGKTSCINALALELYGPKKYKQRILELNASDERGINIVRNKIVNFARSTLCAPDPKYPSPPYKIIILDEADAMTTEAQSALRKVMETYSNITRFCFICNYITQIIEPIISRCAKFRFKTLKKEIINKKLEEIAEKEKIKINKECFMEISEICEGDLRKAIMYLQNLKYLYNYKKNITKKDICELTGNIDENIKKEIKEIIKKIKEKTIKEIKELTKEIINEAYPINILIKEINKIIIYDEEIDNEIKSEICIYISKSEKKLIDGSDEYLQLLSILMYYKKLNIMKK